MEWHELDREDIIGLQESVKELEAKNTEQEGRIIELESAIRWWYTEKMRDYNDNQYGKAQLKRILNINPLVAPLE